MKQQFDLSLWLQDKSRKVVTRSGVEAEIIHDKYPLVAIINGVAYNFDNDGKFQSNKTNHKYDLFFADEKEELTELQKTLEEDCDCYVNLYNDGKTREELREWIKGWCPRIIDLARKELRKEQQEKLGTLEMPIDITEPYYIQGKQDALKDLPKWKKFLEEYKELDTHAILLEDNERVVLTEYLEKGDYYIELSDLSVLKTLPKEE